jgi:hypothetical protein
MQESSDFELVRFPDRQRQNEKGRLLEAGGPSTWYFPN